LKLKSWGFFKKLRLNFDRTVSRSIFACLPVEQAISLCKFVNTQNAQRQFLNEGL